MTGAVEAKRMPAPLLGMLLFVASEVMFFGSLFGAYFTLRARAGTWPGAHVEVALPAVFTLFLLASSVTIHLGVLAIRRGDVPRLLRWLAVTLALGALFIAGQSFEYARLDAEGFRIGTDIFAALFFTMTGFHGLHVLGGLAAITIALAKGRRGDFSAARHGPVEAVSVYWHFVDVVWIFLFSTLYLLR